MSKNHEESAVLMAAIEPLETRRMLSVSLARGVLRVNAGSGDNAVHVAQSGNRIVVTVDGASSSFKTGGVKSIRILAGAGNDSVVIAPGIAATIAGGPGNDRLIGSKAADSIDGGDGNDVINGRGGDDTLLGGAGDDAITGLAGNDSILGGEGRDNLNGGAGNDLMNGEAETDTISGGSGTDFSIDLDDHLTDPDQADSDLNIFVTSFPNFGNNFGNGTGNNTGGGNIFGGGGSIFGGGGSIFD